MTPPRQRASKPEQAAENESAEVDLRHPAVRELESIGVAEGITYSDVWHGHSYFGPAKLIAVGDAAGEIVLTFQVEGAKTYHLCRWAAITRITRKL